MLYSAVDQLLCLFLQVFLLHENDLFELELLLFMINFHSTKFLPEHQAILDMQLLKVTVIIVYFNYLCIEVLFVSLIVGEPTLKF